MTILGLTFDDRLTFRPHAEELLKFMYRNLSFLRRITAKLTGPRRRICELLYKSIVMGKFNYLAEIWSSNILATQKLELQRVQCMFAKLCAGITFKGAHGLGLTG